MIERLTSYDACAGFAAGFAGDPEYSDPMLSSAEEIECNLKKAFGQPDEPAWGVFRDGVLTGLFVFLLLEEERYMEMLVGLSREDAAYEELACFLEKEYPGYQADFVFNPENRKLYSMLEKRGAHFDTEQQKMVLKRDEGTVDTLGVLLCPEEYHGQYVDIHEKDVYWTGDRVLGEPERFNAFVAVENGEVIGYIDVTKHHEENEVFGLFVRGSSRSKGWGRKLLSKAIETNRPKGLMLTVDIDNAHAIALYESAGFEKTPGANSLTANWHISRGS